MNEKTPPMSRRSFLRNGLCNVGIVGAGCLSFGDDGTGDDSPDGIHRGQPVDDSDLELVFEDEFDGEWLDPEKWQTRYPWGAREHNYNGYASEENVYFWDEKLVIKVEEEFQNGRPYKTGVVSSTVPFSSGYVEGYIKVPPARPGFWPAFWLTSASGWPPEIDIFEFFGDDPRAWMTYHYLGSDGDTRKVEESYGGSNFSEEFHLYSVDWTPQRISWGIDGEERFRYSGEHIEIDDMYLIFNFGIDPDFLDSPTEEDLPAYLEAESVRVWEHTDQTDDVTEIERSSGTVRRR